MVYKNLSERGPCESYVLIQIHIVSEVMLKTVVALYSGYPFCLMCSVDKKEKRRRKKKEN